MSSAGRMLEPLPSSSSNKPKPKDGRTLVEVFDDGLVIIKDVDAQPLYVADGGLAYMLPNGSIEVKGEAPQCSGAFAPLGLSVPTINDEAISFLDFDLSAVLTIPVSAELVEDLPSQQGTASESASESAPSAPSGSGNTQNKNVFISVPAVEKDKTVIMLLALLGLTVLSVTR